jgi:hypothetical protein
VFLVSLRFWLPAPRWFGGSGAALLRGNIRAGGTNLDFAGLSVLVCRRNGEPFESVRIHCGGMSLCSVASNNRSSGPGISWEKLGKLMQLERFLIMHMSSLVIPDHGSAPTSPPVPVGDDLTRA